MHFVYWEHSGNANAAVGRYANACIRANGGILNIYYAQMQINKVTQKLTNLISWWSMFEFKSL
jgi:hypothetical protein